MGPRRVLRLARMLCALMYRQNGDLENFLKSARKKSAPGCPFECGGGGGNAQIGAAAFKINIFFVCDFLWRPGQEKQLIPKLRRGRMKKSF